MIPAALGATPQESAAQRDHPSQMGSSSVKLSAMSRIQAVCACALFLAVFGADGRGQAQEDGPAPVNTTESLSARPDDGVASQQPMGSVEGHGHASGSYAGVVPQTASSAPSPDAPPQKARKGPPKITWPGFQMLPDGSSRVFIQSTAPIDAKVLPAADGKFELALPGARVTEQTNRLPLDTRYFNTPVTRVSLSVARSGATLELDLRASVTPHVASRRSSSGYYFTFIELPKGRYIEGSASGSAELPTIQTPKASSKVIGKPAGATPPSSGQAASAQGDARIRAGIRLGR